MIVFMQGICECGCGEPTRPARQTHTKQGTIKGQPVRFRKGHNRRKSPVDYVVDENGCWIWQLATYNSGYGCAYDKEAGKSRIAHRVYYERHVGPIPKGTMIDHRCHTRLCVNPDHLEPVTVTENNRRSFYGRREDGTFLPAS